MKPTAHVVMAMMLMLLCLSRESFGKEPENKSSIKRKSRCELVLGAHVAFFDANGKETKRISIGSKSSDADQNGVFQMKSIDVRGCNTGDFAAVIERDILTDDEASFIKSTDTVSFYSSDGRRLWKKKLLPLGLGPEIGMSTNDRRLLYASEEAEAVAALDSDGNERVFRLPDAKILNQIGLSTNGRYGWVTVYTRDRIEFFDLESGKNHEFMGRGGRARCSNDGLAEVLEENKTGWAQPEKVIHTFQFK